METETQKPDARELIARHFDREAAKLLLTREYGARITAQVWLWVAGRVREVPEAALTEGGEDA